MMQSDTVKLLSEREPVLERPCAVHIEIALQLKGRCCYWKREPSKGRP